MTLALKNPGMPGSPTSPTAMNDVTFTRYRVVYTRADGRNTPGVDVPYPFDSAATFTRAGSGTPMTAGFELVRTRPRRRRRSRATPRLTNSNTFIATIADVTFYGQDRAGNDVTRRGSIGITFGDFGDPD